MGSSLVDAISLLRHTRTENWKSYSSEIFWISGSFKSLVFHKHCCIFTFLLEDHDDVDCHDLMVDTGSLQFNKEYCIGDESTSIIECIFSGGQMGLFGVQQHGKATLGVGIYAPNPFQGLLVTKDDGRSIPWSPVNLKVILVLLLPHISVTK
ncbi:hypothetical protein SUGI_0107780 [Cryptomeria japonica]|nr:hypothetical protein SUGI_0107780 [Cryptomeria japonica]